MLTKLKLERSQEEEKISDYLDELIDCESSVQMARKVFGRVYFGISEAISEASCKAQWAIEYTLEENRGR